MPRAEIDDTYAEAFRSLYAEVLITATRSALARTRRFGRPPATPRRTILCDCEAGLDRYVGPGGDESFATPDGRPGAIVQFHLPRFRKDRVEALERAVLVRVSQNVLTCPTVRASTSCPTARRTSRWDARSRSLAMAINSAKRALAARAGSCRFSPASSSSNAESAIATA